MSRPNKFRDSNVQCLVLNVTSTLPIETSFVQNIFQIMLVWIDQILCPLFYVCYENIYQLPCYKEVSYKAMLYECRASRIFICKHSDHDILNITFQKIYGTSAFIHHCVNGTKFALFYIFNNAETESCNLWQPRHSENNVSLYPHVIAYCFFWLYCENFLFSMLFTILM